MAALQEELHDINTSNIKSKSNTDSSCINGKLVLRGQDIKLSDIKNKKDCAQPKTIEIFALNKVIIDTDLNRTGDQVQLSIIAPTWEIEGSPTITLDGKPGEPHNKAKAPNGFGPGDHGENGNPGNPGGPAGHFIGVGQYFINGTNLSISAQGGKSSPGQDGGDGEKGRDGEKPSVPKNPKDLPLNSCHVIQSYYDTVISLVEKCYVYGGNCTNGGNGGHGGVGGKGGHASPFTLMIGLVEESRVKVVHAQGETGIAGKAGSGNVPGINGQLLITDLVSTVFAGDKQGQFKSKTYEDFQQCESGKSGTSGYNAEGIKNPKKAVVVHVPTIINDYKSYLRENLSNSKKEEVLQKFLNHLENNKSLINLYDALGFVNELQGLEDQFYKLRKKLPFLPFYQSLLGRVSEYAKKGSNKKTAKDSKKVLSYLYTATLSKIISINNNAANNLVIDLKGYLDSAVDDINDLKDVNNAVTINNYEEKYQEDTKRKINEANNFIEKQITQEISDIFDQIDPQIKTLIKEVLDLQKAGKEEKRKLIEQREKMERALILKSILDTAKIVGQVLMLAGPMAAAAEIAIGGGVMVAEAFALDNVSQDSSPVLTALPTAAKGTLAKMTDYYIKKQTLFKTKINTVRLKLEKYLEEPSNAASSLSKIKSKISDYQAELKDEEDKKASLDPASVDKMNNLQREVEKLLKEEEIEIKKKPSGETRKKKIVAEIKNIVRVAKMSANIYDEYKNEQSIIDQLGNTIKQADAKLDKLRQYENSIYRTIIPVCRQMQISVQEMENKLKNKSHVALDVSKWQVQSALKDVKHQMQKMTEGFSVQEDLSHCIDKLIGGINIIIEVYNRIEDYYDKQELAAYIANINSNIAREISINDKLLNNAIDNLALIIKSNLVLEKYEVAMNAFRQHIYPFANYYIDEFNLPPYIKSNDFSSLLSHSTKQIEHLKSKISESTVTIYKYDKYIHSDVTFTSENNHTSPFFVWEHDQNKLAISKLLNGEEIIMRSDILKGQNRNAIKFNVAGIRLKLANETIQHELDKQLQDFEVAMTHSGNSYYRCGNKIHTIISDKQTFTYSFAKKQDGKLLDKNVVYDKLKNNEPVLSPYTMWNIKLTNANNTFDVLQKYKDLKIDLELEGLGQYVDQGIDVCNNNLNRYYTLDGPISEYNNIGEPDNQHLEEMSDNTPSYHLHRHDNKTSYRERRNVKENNVIQGDKGSLFATSGACSNIKSSFINNIFNLMGTSFVMINYLNPVNKITNWFIKDKMNGDEKSLNVLSTNTPIYMELSDIQSLRAKLSEISNISEDKESPTISNVLKNSLFCSHGNLLLLDLLIRCKSGVKYKHGSNVASSNTDFEYAQTLAYKKYVSKYV